MGGPIVKDLLAFRVSALYQHRDNWVDNTFTGTSADGTVSPQKDAMGGFDERDIRFQLLFTPGDRFSVNVSAHARDYERHLDPVPPRRAEEGLQQRRRRAARPRSRSTRR